MGFAQEKNPHSMVSNWPQKDPKTWSMAQRLIDRRQSYPIFPNRPPPVFPKTAKVPYVSQKSQNAWIVFHAAIPLLFHQAWVSLTGYNIAKMPAFLFYTAAYLTISVRENNMLRSLIYKYGCLDGDTHARDGIPNDGAGKILGEVIKTVAFRIAIVVMVTYRPEIAPLQFFSDVSIWSPFLLKLTLYGLIIDFFFYLYHRACHEVPSLWKYHRTHHLTKHPITALGAWADDEQEIIEMMIVPFLTYLTLSAVGLNLNLYEWWICIEFVTFAEIMGHSGLRAHTLIPSILTPLLKLVNMELALEDHDLHHRRGWKKAFNYGKQTRVWDTLFGSTYNRLETLESNVDYNNIIHVPLFGWKT